MRVLLVDDNPMNVELFVDSLAADGHEVAVERDGLAGRERGLREPFDVLILDIQLPGLDGYAICRDLRAAGVNAPILALSSAAMSDQISKGVAAGFDVYLTKPISPSALRDAVRTAGRPA
ncbi:MAG: response regulator [Chloroflexota bacterium]|nr:response regulator [Chloroflexota bacterium]MDE3193791.1 response regulator [Chloroflexota bacterium]